MRNDPWDDQFDQCHNNDFETTNKSVSTNFDCNTPTPSFANSCWIRNRPASNKYNLQTVKRIILLHNIQTDDVHYRHNNNTIYKTQNDL